MVHGTWFLMESILWIRWINSLVEMSSIMGNCVCSVARVCLRLVVKLGSVSSIVLVRMGLIYRLCNSLKNFLLVVLTVALIWSKWLFFWSYM